MNKQNYIVMAQYPKPLNPKTDYASLLAMARNIGLRFNEVERIVFQPAGFKIAAKKQWILDEMHEHGYRVQHELSVIQARKQKL